MITTPEGMGAVKQRGKHHPSALYCSRSLGSCVTWQQWHITHRCPGALSRAKPQMAPEEEWGAENPTRAWLPCSNQPRTARCGRFTHDLLLHAHANPTWVFRDVGPEEGLSPCLSHRIHTR